MKDAAAISAVYRALASYRRCQAHAPTDHSAREIAQMSMLAEYLHENHSPTAFDYRIGDHDPDSLPVDHYLHTQGVMNHERRS